MWPFASHSRNKEPSELLGRPDLWCRHCGFIPEKEGLNYCPSCSERLNAPPISIEARRYLEVVTKRQVIELTDEKNFVVREVRIEALNATVSSVRNWAWIVGIPTGFLFIVLAIWGVKDAYTFLHLVEPRIKQTQETIVSQSVEINKSQLEINAQTLQLTADGSIVARQANELRKYEAELKKFGNKVTQQEAALASVSQEATTLIQNQETNALETAYPFTVKGEVSVRLGGLPFKPPVITPENPLVYLISPETNPAFDFTAIRAFSDRVKAEGFQQIVGSLDSIHTVCP